MGAEFGKGQTSRSDRFEDCLLVGDILGGLLPDSGEIVATSIEKFEVFNHRLEVTGGKNWIAGTTEFKDLVVVMAD